MADNQNIGVNSYIQVQQIQQQILDTLTVMEARIDAGDSRRYNSLLGELNDRNFKHIPKIIANHPAEVGLPPHIGGVVFQAQYNIRDPPPAGLMPTNRQAFISWAAMNLPMLRKRLRAVWWFYNDPSLTLANGANRHDCIEALERLKEFILIA